MSQVSSDHFSEDAREFERKKYALVVGANQSTNMPTIPLPLRCAESDAAGVSYLLGREACNFVFPSGYLIGTAASTQNVRKAMSYLTDDKSENDLLLFYFIGHSYPIMTADGRIETYIVTSDFDPEQARLSPNAYISLSEIHKILFEHQNIASVVCILDCCYAGTSVEPDPLEQQLTQSLQALAKDIADTTPASVSSHRTQVVLASTGSEGIAYENKDHAHMTGLIISMLNGEISDALDHDGNLTLLTLYSYLQKMPMPKGQDPIIGGQFGSIPWVLAQHPSENRVARKLEERSRLSQSSSYPPFDMSPSPAAFADLDLQQIQAFLKKQRVQLQQDYRADLSEQGQMEALGLLHGEHPSYGALLCFGRNPSHQIVGAYTRCVYWIDRERLSGWIDDKECHESLLDQFTQACKFLRSHLHISRIIDHSGSREQSEIPFRALEEAVANALVHREYVTEPDHTVRTEGIQVEIFSDRVEITSPGGSPVPLNPEHPISYPRNPEIQWIFYLAGHVEKIGTGLMRINQWMQKAGLPKPIRIVDQQAFTIILHRRVQSPAPPAQGNTNTRTSQPQTPLSEDSDALITQSIHDSSGPNKNKKTHIVSRAARYHLKNPGLIHWRVKDGSVWAKAHQRLLLKIFVVLTILALVVFVDGRLNYLLSPRLPLVPAPTTIKIASDFPTSGLDTTDGLPLQNGVQMAITEANNEHLFHGYTLKLVPYDDVGRDNRHDPQVGAANLTRAIADNLVAGVIGPYNSSVALKQLPLANQAPLAMLSPSATYPCLTKNATDDPNCTGTNDIATQMHPTNQLTFFRLATTDDQQGKAAADYFFQTKHYSKVLLLKDDSDLYSFGLARAFQEEWQRMGNQILAIDSLQNMNSVQDYQNTLQMVASFQPDLIYFAGTTPSGSYVLQALSNIETLNTLPFAGGDGIMNTTLLQTAASLHRTASIYVSLPIEDPAHLGTSTGRDFAANYMANGDQYYRPYAAAAYDCTMILIQAIKTALQKGVSTPHGAQDYAGAKTFRQAVLQAIRQHSYTGATGTHRFDANGDTTNHTISFYQANLSTPQPNWTWLKQVTT